MFRCLLTLALLLIISPPVCFGQSKSRSGVEDKQADVKNKQEEVIQSQGPDVETTTSSQARNLTELQKLLQLTQSRLERLKTGTRPLQREFDLRSKRFTTLDANLTKLKEKSQQVEDEGLEEELDRQEQQWRRAKDDFDFIIELTQANKGLILILEEKIELFKIAKDRLLNPLKFKRQIEAALLSGQQVNEMASGETDQAPMAITPFLSIPQGVLGKGSQEASGNAQTDHRFDYRSADAAKEVFHKQVQLAREDENAELVAKINTVYKKSLLQVQELLDLLNQRQEKLLGWVQEEPQNAAQAKPLMSKSDVARAQAELKEIRKSLANLQEDKQGIELMRQKLEVAREHSSEALDRAEAELDQAIRALEFVQSPFAPHRVKRWIVQKLPGMFITILVLIGVWFLLHLLAKRSLSVLEASTRRGTREERKERAETIHRVIRNLITLLVLGIGVVILLEQAGIDMTVLLGSAALIGVAVTFGAQSLIKDYFHGALVLLEDQYRVGNVVKVGDIAGLVEDITLRMMVLRDLSGTLHFIPHGQVSQVSNLTYGWSRVVFDIGVAYKEDVDEVMELLLSLAHELKQDNKFGIHIIDEPEMLGVDEFADSAVIIKFLLKTKPLKQWLIKRELLRRIKNAFDEKGIEIPFPHRTLYMGSEVEFQK